MAAKFKPGDLVFAVTRNPEYKGRVWEILHRAPVGEFDLPDGHPAIGGNHKAWVLRVVGEPVAAPVGGDGWRLTYYGVGVEQRLVRLPVEKLVEAGLEAAYQGVA